MNSLPKYLCVDVKDLAIVVGWFLTIFGWLVSNVQANQRETRKEVRKEVDACCDMANDLLDTAKRYYCAPPTSESEKELAAKIRFDLKTLLTRTERLQRNHRQFTLFEAGGELMDTLTGGDFASSSRIARGHEDELLRKVESATHELISQCETGFEATFKPKRPSIAGWLQR